MRKFCALIALLLLCLALAAEGWAWIRSGFSKNWLKARLNRETMLFTTAGESLRGKIGRPLFLAALTLLLTERIFWQSSQLFSRTPDALMSPLNGVLYPLIFLLLTAKFFFFTRFSGRQLLRAAALYLLFLFAMSGNYEYGYFAACGVILSCKDINWRACLKIFLAVTTASVLVLAALTMAGILGNYSTYVRADNAPRLIFGFQHPSLLGMYLFSCVSCLFLLQFGKKGIARYFVFAAAFYVAAVLADSRGSTLALLVLALLLILARFLPAFFRIAPIRLGLILAPVLCAAILFIPTALIPPEKFQEIGTLLNRFNIITSDRLRLISAAFHTHTPALRGQTVLSAYANDPYNVYALDNSYAYLLFYGGILLFLLGLAALCLLMHRMLKAGRYELAAVLCAWLVFGMMEQYLLYPWTNCLVLLFSGLLYCRPLPAQSSPDL